MIIKFDKKPVYDDKYTETKIKMYHGKVNTNFQGKEVPKENASYRWLSLIMLDSVLKINKKYYPQTLLEECKYEIKKTKMENLLNDDLEKSSSDESDDESNDESESDNEINNDESNDLLNVKTVL